MAWFLGKQVLSFVVWKETFAKDLKLGSKLINIVDFFATEPLRSQAVFYQDFVVDGNIMADAIEPQLCVRILNGPYCIWI